MAIAGNAPEPPPLVLDMHRGCDSNVPSHYFDKDHFIFCSIYRHIFSTLGIKMRITIIIFNVNHDLASANIDLRQDHYYSIPTVVYLL